MYWLLFAFFGFLRGLHEGMTMIQEFDIMAVDSPNQWDKGVRCHVWFGKYHTIETFTRLIHIIMGGMIVYFLPNLSIVVGAFTLYWEFAELGYSYARYKTFIPYKGENIFGLGFVIKDKNVLRIFHLFRIMIGLYLIHTGLNMG